MRSSTIVAYWMALILALGASSRLVAQQDFFQKGLAAQDPMQKISFFTRALEQELTRDAYYERGKAYLSIGQEEASMLDFERALQYPGQVDDALLYTALCNLYYLRGEYAKAVTAGGQALAANPKNIESLWYRGWSYMSLQNYSSALADFTQFAQLQPLRDYAHAALARAQYRLGQADAALSAIDRAIELNPSNPTYPQLRIMVLEKLGRRQEADSLLRANFNYIQDDPSSLSEIGTQYFLSGEYELALDWHDRAISLYQAILAKNPGYQKTNADEIYNIYYNRGATHYALKDYQKALADWTKAANIQPTNFMVWNRIGELQTFQNNWAECVKAYEKSFKLNPTYPSGWVNYGFCYSNMGKRIESIKVYDRALQLPDVESPGLILNNRGFSYLELKQYDKAFADLQDAIARQPQICMSHISLGEYYVEREAYDQAIQKFNYALSMPMRSNRETSTAHYKRGLAFHRQKLLDQAIKDYQKAIEVDPSLVEAYEHLGIAYYETDNLCAAYNTLLQGREQMVRQQIQVPNIMLYTQKVLYQNPSPCK